VEYLGVACLAPGAADKNCSRNWKLERAADWWCPGRSRQLDFRGTKNRKIEKKGKR